ncbi:hypothetical protein SASPL_110171 [Salvia splendens]|uniref:SET domain-containing protein n=1 Tax=Salvia splendens TaxID=180675 RepID=A0A8X8Y9G7_SALSN|nr:hypothetical protein SASPL_110171 [Salvia splendens]
MEPGDSASGVLAPPQGLRVDPETGRGEGRVAGRRVPCLLVLLSVVPKIGFSSFQELSFRVRTLKFCNAFWSILLNYEMRVIIESIFFTYFYGPPITAPTVTEQSHPNPQQPSPALIAPPPPNSALPNANPLLSPPPTPHSFAPPYAVSAPPTLRSSSSTTTTASSKLGDALADDASVFLHSVISTICQLPNSGELGVSVELTAALLAKDKLNAFGLMEPFNQGKERSVRAYGLYPTASFFNHDCLPNACRFDYVDSASEFSNTDITIRVIHDLPAGREICLSYFPVNFKYVERQQRLKEDYGFVCDCDRCKVEANWSDDEEEGEGEMNRDVGDDDMDEDGDDEEGDLETTDSGMDKEGEDDSFPHAYFFIRYMCSVDNCGGTLAPVPPVDARPSTVMECNVCGSFSKFSLLLS